MQISPLDPRQFQLLVDYLADQDPAPPALLDDLRSDSISPAVDTPPGDPPSVDSVQEVAIHALQKTSETLPSDEETAREWYSRLGENSGQWYANSQTDYQQTESSHPQQTVALISKAVEAGSSAAMCALGFALRCGFGVQTNSYEAVEWFLLGAASEHLGELHQLGIRYLHGIGCKKNPHIAAIIFSAGANRGDALCSKKLGRCYETGTGVPQDPKKAFEYVSQAADAGDDEASYILGIYHQQGFGTDKNVDEANKLFLKEGPSPDYPIEDLATCFLEGIGRNQNLRKAFFLFYAIAKRDEALPDRNTFAMHTLAQLYLDGTGTDKDEKESFKWFLKAAEAGDLMSILRVVLCYQSGIGVTKDPMEAIVWLTKGANLGDALCSKHFAWCYANGIGVPQDPKKAFEYISKAADAGDDEASYILGFFHQQGFGTDKNVDMANKLFLKEAPPEYHSIAALANCFLLGIGCTKNPRKAFLLFCALATRDEALAEPDTFAMRTLAKLFLNGTGTDKNEQEAFIWFLKAAEAGDLLSIACVALCYQSGIGITKDPAEAVVWLRKAAQKNYHLAMNNLACCYFTGNGVQPDTTEAIARFKQAAVFEPAAQCNLGYCYEHGKGVPKNTEMAKRMYENSAPQYADAWNLLGLLHLSTLDNPLDDTSVNRKRKMNQAARSAAVDCFKKGVEKENPLCTYHLAYCYKYGLGVPADDRMAEELFTRAKNLDCAQPCITETGQLIPEAYHRYTEEEIKLFPRDPVKRVFKKKVASLIYSAVLNQCTHETDSLELAAMVETLMVNSNFHIATLSQR